MSWIKIIEYDQAAPPLKKLYDRVKGPDNYIDNILKVHSLRPHTLKGHMVLYKNVLHHQQNTLPKWLLETLGVYVSLLNNCAYCVEHHFAGLKRLIQDDVKSNQIREALERNQPKDFFNGKELALLQYAYKVTRELRQMEATDLIPLRNNGLNDGEILEANQVISYFNYANRTVLGLGVTIQGDILGLSPSDDSSEESWSHK